MLNTAYKKSFFDDSNNKDYKPWKKADSEMNNNFSKVKIYEGSLFKKSSKSNFLKSHYYVLFEDRLSFQKNNVKQNGSYYYCIIQNMRLERVSTQTTEKDDRYGFLLTHNEQSICLYARTKEQQDNWINKLKSYCVLMNYAMLYTNIKIIGKGSFAKVYLVKRKTDNSDLAVKTFEKSTLENDQKKKDALINEINLMRGLNHDNIIKLYEVHENDSYVFLVVELLKGGELFDRIVKKGSYIEREACMVMMRLLSALDYMHSKGLMHRDIKLENLILKEHYNDYDIKIVDFGLATPIQVNGEYLYKKCGTPGYVAPEILNNQNYNEKIDVYSAGIILYILLTGSAPFHGKNYEEIVKKNKNSDINFNFHEGGIHISPQGIDLLKKMLEKNPNSRLSTHECLQHEWIVFNSTNKMKNEENLIINFHEKPGFPIQNPIQYHSNENSSRNHHYYAKKLYGYPTIISHHSTASTLPSKQMNTTILGGGSTTITTSLGIPTSSIILQDDECDEQLLEEHNSIYSTMNKYQYFPPKKNIIKHMCYTQNLPSNQANNSGCTGFVNGNSNGSAGLGSSNTVGGNSSSRIHYSKFDIMNKPNFGLNTSQYGRTSTQGMMMIPTSSLSQSNKDHFQYQRGNQGNNSLE